jgi:hypothetical protein
MVERKKTKGFKKVEKANLEDYAKGKVHRWGHFRNKGPRTRWLRDIWSL